MMKKLSQYTCAICRLDFKFDDVRYSPDGKRLVCKSCHAKMNKNKKEFESMGHVSPELYARKMPKPNTIEVMCTHCNYKFFYRKDFKPICPYCGRTSLQKYEELTADRIIDEVGRMQ